MSTATSAGGIIAFGPQPRKGVAVPSNLWFAHRALDADFAVVDDGRTFPAEIGGRPLPGGAYKGGVSAGGGISMHPRLENAFGWLLYATLGKKASTQKALVYEGILKKTALTSSEKIINAADLVGGGDLPDGAGKLCVRVWKGDHTAWAGTVTIAGEGEESETFNFASGPGEGQRSEGFDTNPSRTAVGYETIVGAVAFTSVTSVTLPDYEGTEPVYISVGYEDAVAKVHEFTIDDDSPTKVNWLGVRKYIPKTDDGAGVGETFYDVKPINAALNLPNDGPITYRMDGLGCDYMLEEDPSWAESPSFEGFDSVPISTVIGGYITIPAFSADPLPVIGATFAWQNTPLDQRQERVYGNPFLPDVTITDRSMAVQLTVKYQNPDLYRALTGNSRLATKWDPTPFMTRVDVTTVSSGLIPGSMLPFAVRAQMQHVMLSIRGGIPLAGSDAVLLRLIGTAIDNGGKYASWSLQNAQADYEWPEE